MPPSNTSPVMLYSRQPNQSASNPSARIAAVIIPIIIVAIVLWSLCCCCRRKRQPRNADKWWNQPQPTARDHQLGDYDYNREVNRNNQPASGAIELDTLPEYSSVPRPPPAYVPNGPQPQSELYAHPPLQSELDSPPQPQTNTHARTHASGEGKTNTAVGETSTTAELPSRETV